MVEVGKYDRNERNNYNLDINELYESAAGTQRSNISCMSQFKQTGMA
jgi:hypothetical protein